MILGWYFGTGGPFMPGIVLILAACMAAGWLVGPRATGRLSADIVAMFGYYVVGYLLAATVASALVAAEAMQEGSAASLRRAVEEVWQLWLARFVYLPVFGVLLSPAVLAWILAIRVLRGRLGT
ncbi:MAG TPA: hypothetical protein VF494_02295 [Candidatus Limnocylindrales bacterium]